MDISNSLLIYNYAYEYGIVKVGLESNFLSTNNEYSHNGAFLRVSVGYLNEANSSYFLNDRFFENYVDSTFGEYTFQILYTNF
jgi:hypothetical protein